MDKIRRHLTIDPLEERHLLSVSPLTPFDNLVNETISLTSEASEWYPHVDPQYLSSNLDQTTYGGQSIAVDNDGDFVIVWSRHDPVYDENGDLVYDDLLDEPMSDQNIYARYFTDEVQRITLPAAVDNDEVGGYASFELGIGGNELQKLTISNSAMTYWPDDFSSLVGSFVLTFDVNGDGSIGANEQATIHFDEFAMETNAAHMQTQLQAMGGALADIEVTAISPQEYTFQFGEQSGGLNQPLIGIDPTYTAYDSTTTNTLYYLPGTVFETINEPLTVTVMVEPGNAAQTAANIEGAFARASSEHYLLALATSANDADYGYKTYYDWKIEANPVGGSNTQFDITFTGSVSKTNVALMSFVDITDERGNPLWDNPTLEEIKNSVVTIKETSPEFRVNNPDEQKGSTPYFDYTDQSAPAVAMDADGDFVITWQSEVIDNTTRNSDIWARRFTPTGWTENPEFVMEDGTEIQGVKPFGDEFKVNTRTARIQNQPAIGMDKDGNFVIGWTDTNAQDLDVFCNVYIQRYNRDGERIGGEFPITDADGFDSDFHFDPYVSLSDDGHILVTWSETNDPHYLHDSDFDIGYGVAAAGWARLFSPNMETIETWSLEHGTWNTTSVFDSGNNFIISGEATEDDDRIFDGNGDAPDSTGIYAREYAINETESGIEELRPWYRVNSANFEPSTLPVTPGTDDEWPMILWPGNQSHSQVMVDADGDFTVTYEGYAPDVSEDLVLYAEDFEDVINDQQNADLITYLEQFELAYGSILNRRLGSAPGYDTGDLDAEIELVLLEAYAMGADWEQLGRLRSALNTKAALFRGDPNGVMYTAYHAVQNASANVLNSDVVVNTQRDSVNERYIITIPRTVQGGSFTVTVAREDIDGYYDDGTTTINADAEAVVITPVIVNQIIEPNRTTGAIESALRSALITGIARNGASVEVRRIDETYEWSLRENTPWEWYNNPATGNDYVYEVTFQGSAHDTYFSMGLTANNLNPDGTPSPYIYETMEANNGTIQTQPSAGMTPDGSFVVAWTQYEEYSNGFYSNSNIYFREYQESEDTAGPQVTDFLLPDGERLANGDQVNEALKNIVVTFDEELAVSGYGSVLDPDNWALMKYDDNGNLVEIRGGIVDVDFGMNRASDLADQLGLNTLGTNKWEAILTLDGNGNEEGVTTLDDGDYVIVAKNEIRDIADKPLGHTGYTVNGFDILRNFTVTLPTGSETIVNSSLFGLQETLPPTSTEINSSVFPNSPQSIAGDADGECVVVWVDETGTAPGVHAKIYPVTWVEDADHERQSFQELPIEIVVTDDPTAIYASVARDGDGDFVVTWSAKDTDGDWNVWYRTFDAAGHATSDAEMANSRTEGFQRFSTVAMDNDGDFVITWQSQALDQEDYPNDPIDDSGYGIYAQRFTFETQYNEIQTLDFSNIATATFNLDLDYLESGFITNDITYNYATPNALIILAQDIQAEFDALGVDAVVSYYNNDVITINYVGANAGKDVPEIRSSLKTLLPIKTLVDGEGEGKYVKLGGINEAQTIELKGEIEFASFALNFDYNGTNLKTGAINYSINNEYPLETLVRDIQEQIDLLSEIDAKVIKLENNKIAIKFDESSDCKDQKPIVFDYITVVGEQDAKLELDTFRGGQTSEILVNETIAGNQMWPSIAMDYKGEFIISWTGFGQDGDDAIESNIYARKFDSNDALILAMKKLDQDLGAGISDTTDLSNGLPLGNTFLVNVPYISGHWEVDPNDQQQQIWVSEEDDTPVRDNQKWSSVAMDGDGDFVITWTGDNQDGSGNGYGPNDDGVNGIFARRFDSDAGNSETEADATAYAVFQVNTFVERDQQHSSVAMDTDGDFIITWESEQEKPTPGDGPDAPATFGIYAQRYVSNDKLGTGSFIGENGEIGGELHVNTSTAGQQLFPSVTMSDTGDAYIVWNSSNSIDTDGGIFMQRFEKPEDDTGPRVTDVSSVSNLVGFDIIRGVKNDDTIEHNVKQMVITFGEDMNLDYLEQGNNSILNPDNWELHRQMTNGTINEIIDGIADIIFEVDAAYNYGLADAPTGKFQAIVTFDMENNKSGIQELEKGQYVLKITEDAQDLFDNAIQSNPYNWDATGFEFEFSIKESNTEDTPISPNDPDGVAGENGHTYPESASAIAVDGDGDYVIAYTATNPDGVDRVYLQRFDKGGTPVWDEPVPVVPDDCLAGNSQRYASIACDPDGDFVVTWTNYSDEDGSDLNGQEQVDIYAQRFSASGAWQDCPSRVNTYTAGEQIWSDVAMDADGGFVVTWSSLGQENNGMPGYGYGIYARQFDPMGYALGSEFQVNTTSGGNQQFSSVAVAADGTFVITWQSDQNGIGKNIVARAFNPDGSAKVSPLGGEYIVNDVENGDQTYPDVAIDLSGETFVVTWTSTQGTDDPNGSGIYTKAFNILDTQDTELHYEYLGDPVNVPHQGDEPTEVTIFVEDGFLIEDLDIQLNIQHDDPSDLWVWLVAPDGTEVLLFSGVPLDGDQDGVSTGGNGANFTDTIFDDDAETAIDDEEALPPFNGTFSPVQALAAFNNQNAYGTWTLRVLDDDPSNDPDEWTYTDYLRLPNEDGGRIMDFSLDFVRQPDISLETLVNTTTAGNQVYSSVAMDYNSNFVVTWSGYGDQEDQEDRSDYGVFTQEFALPANKIGEETRVNKTTIGRQWLSSVGTDAAGNYVTIWTGVEDPGTTAVYARGSTDGEDPDVDTAGPVVGGVYQQNQQLFQGEVLGGTVNQLIVTFNEELNGNTTIEDNTGVQGTPLESVFNVDNWTILLNGSEIIGGITEIHYGLNSFTQKYEAVVTFDGDGLSPGSEGLGTGHYELILRDTVTDVEGNRLDGDYDGKSASDTSTTDTNGFRFTFNVADSDDRFGPEVRANDNTELVQLLSQSYGTGQARETSVRSVAIDDNGDYVVVWTTTGLDDENDPNGKGVYFQLYNEDGTKKDEPVRVNNIITGHQQNASVAMDSAGDFVVVWESEQADGTYDIYAQRFNADGSRVANDRVDRIDDDPLRGTAGFTQLDATENFTSRGLTHQDIEVIVNTTQTYNQINPEVAMDSYGNFAVVWGSASTSYSYFNDVNIQVFDYDGEPVSEELRANDLYTPGSATPGAVPGFTVNPSIAMDNDGKIAVVWDQITSQTSGVAVDTEIVGVLLDLGPGFINTTMEDFLSTVSVATGTGATPLPIAEVSGDITADLSRTARNPQVALDSNGHGVVVYEAYLDADNVDDDDTLSYGIFYSLFEITENTDTTDTTNDDTTPTYGSTIVVTASGEANTVLEYELPDDDTSELSDASRAALAFIGDQVNPSVAMDANGNFAISWDGPGSQPDPIDQTNPDLLANTDDAGVWVRWFNSSGDATTTQQRVNMTEAGKQNFGSIAMNRDGDVVVAWSGAGIGDRHGIFSREYDSIVNSVGPLATELYHKGENPNVGAGDSYLFVGDGERVYGNPTSMLVVFSEEMNTSMKTSSAPGIHSVENVNNWALINGRNEEVSGAIDHVDFYMEPTLNKWVAEVFFSGTGLQNGTYTLIARTDIYDAAGNLLDKTGYRPNGTGINLGDPAVLDDQTDETEPDPLYPLNNPTGGFGFQFGVNNTLPGDPNWGDVDQQVNAEEFGREDDAVVARNAAGDYVVAWVEYTPVAYIDPNTDETDNDDDTPSNAQPDYTDPWFLYEANIMVQRFDFWGREVDDQIQVNSLPIGTLVTETPLDLAIDDAGNFVVVWSGDNTLIEGEDGIFMQRFDYDGDKMGGQVRVNNYRDDVQTDPSVAMVGATGDFVVSWTSFGQDGNQDAIIAKRYNLAGVAQGSEFIVNSYTQGAQRTSDVAIDAAGNFVVTWMGEEYNGAGWGIYGRRFYANGTARGSEFHVNTLTTSDQITPAVAMDTLGNFVVTWASYVQGNNNVWDIYARRFNHAGTALGNDFLVNQTTNYNQKDPDVAMATDKGFVITWTSFNQDYPYDEDIRDNGVFARMYNSDGSNYVDTRIGTSPIGEFQVNADVLGDQMNSSVSMDAYGHFIVVWTGPNRVGTIGELVDTDAPDTDTTGNTGDTGNTNNDGEAVSNQTEYGNWVDANGDALSAYTLNYVVELDPLADDTDTGDTGDGEGPIADVANWLLDRESTSIYSRLIDPPIVLTAAVEPEDVTIMGTSGDDVIEFIGSPSQTGWVIKVNGTFRDIGNNVGTLTFDGLGGNDTLLFTGSSENDSITLAPGSSSFLSNHYSVVANHIESITANGGTGDNVVTFQDTTNDDTLIIQPNLAELTGGNFTFRAENCMTIVATSATGNDTVKIYDTSGNDTFTATPTQASMVADGYDVATEGFRYAMGYSTAGTDTANLYDSAGDDQLITQTAYAKLSGSGFYSIASDFRYIAAYASTGNDTAMMYDSAGNDEFEAGPNYAKFSTDTYYVRADDFDSVNADGSKGGTNSAIFYGSVNDDILIAGSNYGKLSGDGFNIRATFFQKVTGYGMGGDDMAQMLDTTGDDTLLVTNASTRLIGPGCDNRAYGFSTVEAYALNGGNDVATMNDSSSEDLLESEGNWVRMSSSELDYIYTLLSFDQVTAYSSTAGDKMDIDRSNQSIDFLLAQGYWEDID